MTIEQIIAAATAKERLFLKETFGYRDRPDETERRNTAFVDAVDGWLDTFKILQGDPPGGTGDLKGTLLRNSHLLRVQLEGQPLPTFSELSAEAFWHGQGIVFVLLKKLAEVGQLQATSCGWNYLNHSITTAELEAFLLLGTYSEAAAFILAQRPGNGSRGPESDEIMRAIEEMAMVNWQLSSDALRGWVLNSSGHSTLLVRALQGQATWVCRDVVRNTKHFLVTDGLVWADGLKPTRRGFHILPRDDYAQAILEDAVVRHEVFASRYHVGLPPSLNPFAETSGRPFLGLATDNSFVFLALVADGICDGFNAPIRTLNQMVEQAERR
ncbi:MAG: hypothetical protein UW86_C0005G0022 [Microgenomates group bacterium GW2011_GWA1_Microgenomates_45_10]|nr:MAG: hypothetical protein UW69_C0005G0022 [Microgenomates group bacterium GW2011_GWA2_44_7]KKT77612.1 MAG: hypothetical protein UW73_C0016G0022 [Microgenomates group bacterium GW2011_GWB1_44_8]KKT87281.1 MAG: hypothetical protein UW86_C0005G0022 [Microgenomates group bacterium GW2011_GWA1_Microgenomates_45_10]